MKLKPFELSAVFFVITFFTLSGCHNPWMEAILNRNKGPDIPVTGVTVT